MMKISVRALMVVVCFFPGIGLLASDDEFDLPDGSYMPIKTSDLARYDSASYRQLTEPRSSITSDVDRKILTCASKLIEKRYGDMESVYAGINILDELLEASDQRREMWLALGRCEEKLAIFKEAKRNQTIMRSKKRVTSEELDHLKSHIATLHGRNSQILWPIAKRGVSSSNMVCTPSWGASVGAALYFSASLSINTYQCITPLGRRLALRGGGFGLGMGVGAYVSGSTGHKMKEHKNGDVSKSFFFALPMNSSSIQTLCYEYSNASVILPIVEEVGLPDVYDTRVQTNSLGLGILVLAQTVILRQSEQPSEFAYLRSALGIE